MVAAHFLPNHQGGFQLHLRRVLSMSIRILISINRIHANIQLIANAIIRHDSYEYDSFSFVQLQGTSCTKEACLQEKPYETAFFSTMSPFKKAIKGKKQKGVICSGISQVSMGPGCLFIRLFINTLNPPCFQAWTPPCFQVKRYL